MKDPKKGIIGRDLDPELLGQGTLVELLDLEQPPFAVSDPFVQLRYVERYVATLGCSSVLVEEHYIDRDYMEDHSVFYSRSLHPYPNSCRRVHFFSQPLAEVDTALQELFEFGLRSTEESYRARCREFSKQTYLGFSVVKPLSGTPVGRTVLRCPAGTSETALNSFECTRDYVAHLLGVELSIRGLAFQQQDIGVGACATVALWSSLQKFRASEDIGLASPARITQLAGKSVLPFGRPMPSPGLSLGQMCQALEALGVSAEVYHPTKLSTAKRALHIAIASGFAPLLLLNRKDDLTGHAVTVAGMGRSGKTEPMTMGVVEQAASLTHLYIHDDRRGPYLTAALVQHADADAGKETRLRIPIQGRVAGREEEWIVSHILIPLHRKIRLSIAELGELSATIAKTVFHWRSALLVDGQLVDAELEQLTFTYSASLQRSYRYLETAFVQSERSFEKMKRLATSVSMPRYVGVLRFEGEFLGRLDLLVDTTNTLQNTHLLAAVASGPQPALLPELGELLTDRHGGSWIC
jgi:hypothetical protein